MQPGYQYHKICFIVRSRKALKARDRVSKWSYCFEIWQVPWQQCSQDICKIPEQLETSSHQSHTFETLRHLMIRRLRTAWGHDPWLPRVTALLQMTLSFFKPYRSPRWRYCDVMTKQNKTQQWARGGHLHHGDMDNWSVLWLRGNNRKSRWWPLVKRHNWCVYKSGFGPSQGPSSGAFNAVLRELTCCRACAQINNYRWGAYLVVGLVSKVVPGLVGQKKKKNLMIRRRMWYWITPLVTYMHQWTWSSLVQVMACYLFPMKSSIMWNNAKLLSTGSMGTNFWGI